MSDTAKFYDRTAEHVAVLLSPTWAGLGPVLAKALHGLDTTSGPVVDVGAGSGLGTAVIARALPDARVLAVEPDRALRTALLASLARDADLAARVTVLAEDVLAAPLPQRVSGLVAMNVLGHLTPTERTRLWEMLAAVLSPTGRAVVTLSPPTSPTTVPPTPMAEVTIGDRVYTGTAAAEPAGEDSIIWHMTYRVTERGEQLAEFTASDRWYVQTPTELAAELVVHGLRVTEVDAVHGVHVITR